MSVLVLVPDEASTPTFVAWGHQFAVTRGESLVLVVPTALPGLHQAATAARDRIDPEASLVLCESPDEFKTVLGLLAEHNVTLVVASPPIQRSSTAIGPKLFQKAECDVILLRAAQKSGERCERILIPVTPSPHTHGALKLGDKLATDENGVVRALYAISPNAEDPELFGEHLLARTLERAGVQATGHILPEVVVADSLMDGVQAATEDEVDLLLIGAPNAGLMRQALFGTVPEQLLKENPNVAVAIFRARPDRWDQAQRLLDRVLNRYVPQLDRDTRLNLHETLGEGSGLSMDFITLICLSTAIASLGLIQNSGAVVIGAMLVAPLMTPMLGTGLGLVQGNLVLVRDASRSILVGFFLSLLIGMTAGYLTPGFRELTPELMARGNPNLLDLIIALLSGVAAAYAMARPGLLAALPGVAIAAALVPPIATAGIALSTGHALVGVRAAFLFGTNLVAIVLASALTLFVLGIRPNRKQKQVKVWARRVLVGLSLTALFFALPLGASLVGNFTERPEPLRAALEATLRATPHISVRSSGVVREGNEDVFRIEIYSPSPLSPEVAQDLSNTAQKNLDSPLPVRVVTLLEWRGP